MDVDKIKQLMELASNVYGTGFWKDVFDQNSLGQLMGLGENTMNTSRDKAPRTNHAPNMMAPNMMGNMNPPAMTGIPHTGMRSEFPLVDIVKKDGKIIIFIDLPGINKEDVQLMVYQNYLIIKGTPKSKLREGEIEIVYSERRHGPFERHIPLPEPTDGNSMTAKFHNGVLQVVYAQQAQSGEIVPIE